MQFNRNLKLAASSLLLPLVSSSACANLSVTLDTRATNASAQVDFSTDFLSALNASNVGVSGLGTTKPLSTSTNQSFSIPTTNLGLSISENDLTIVSFSAVGAALDFKAANGSELALGNFNFNLTTGTTTADAWVNGQKSSLAAFSFTVSADSTINFTSKQQAHQILNHLTLTSDGVNAFAAAFGIDPSANSLTSIDLGSITFDIDDSVLRPGGVVSGLPFAPVPEPATYALVAIGLGVTSVVARRRRS